MVDSVKNQPNIQQSQTLSNRSSNASLRESFKSISSGLSVAQAVREAPGAPNPSKSQGSSQNVGRIVTNLQDAVKFSKEALKALEEVATNSAAGDSNVEVVQEFAKDLTELREDIASLLDDLRARASAAEVLNENIEASDPKLEDVEKAQAKAQSASDQIAFNSEEALNAHGGRLTFETVARLLAET